MTAKPDTVKQIVMVGSIGTGYEFYGPFDANDDAVAWGEHEYPHFQWEVVPLYAPKGDLEAITKDYNDRITGIVDMRNE